MEIRFSPQAKKKLRIIKKKDKILFRKIKKQLKILLQDPQYPSLRLHKLSGDLQDSWSIAVSRGYRVVFYYSTRQADRIVVYKIGTHKEVYER